MRRAVFVLAGMCLLLWMTGCAVNRATAVSAPGIDLGKITSFYIVEEPGDRGTNNIYEIIQANLMKRGYTVMIGPDVQSTDKSDAVLVYRDKWMWDMSMYLLELTITFKDPASSLVMASGNSFHTSLTRLTPEEMVDEVLTNIFKAKPAP